MDNEYLRKLVTNGDWTQLEERVLESTNYLLHPDGGYCGYAEQLKFRQARIYCEQWGLITPNEIVWINANPTQGMALMRERFIAMIHERVLK